MGPCRGRRRCARLWRSDLSQSRLGAGIDSKIDCGRAVSREGRPEYHPDREADGGRVCRGGYPRARRAGCERQLTPGIADDDATSPTGACRRGSRRLRAPRPRHRRRHLHPRDNASRHGGDRAARPRRAHESAPVPDAAASANTQPASAPAANESTAETKPSASPTEPAAAAPAADEKAATGEPKAPEAPATDVKSSDLNPADAKATEAKPTEAKSAEPQPAK